VEVRCEDVLERDSGERDRGSWCGRDEETIEAFEKVC
jgi:hypothetical protein